MSRPKGSKDKKPQHKWTDEEKEYLASIVKGSTYKEITEKMNDKFEYNFYQIEHIFQHYYKISKYNYQILEMQ